MERSRGGRTPDLLIANEALSQLSYGPARCSRARLIAASAGHLGLGIEGVKDRQGTRRRGDSSAVVLVYVASPRYILCTILGSESQSMRALFLVIDLALEIYIWILIAAAVFSWLIAFNVVNVRNSIVSSIGDFLFRITEPARRPRWHRRYCAIGRRTQRAEGARACSGKRRRGQRGARQAHRQDARRWRP